MKYKCLVIGLMTILFSCNSMLTENEDRGVKEILDFFGGYCKYSIGVSASTEDEEKKYFELELSQSESLVRFKDNKEIITSKLAYVFFNNLNNQERGNYTHIRGSLLYDNGETFSKDYSMHELELVEKKLPLVEKAVSLIKNKQFEKLKEIVNDEKTFRYDKGELLANMERLEPDFGKITEYRLFGFKFSNAGNEEVLKISGIVLRDKNNHELSVFFDPNSRQEEILKIDYRL